MSSSGTALVAGGDQRRKLIADPERRLLALEPLHRVPLEHQLPGCFRFRCPRSTLCCHGSPLLLTTMEAAHHSDITSRSKVSIQNEVTDATIACDAQTDDEPCPRCGLCGRCLRRADRLQVDGGDPPRPVRGASPFHRARARLLGHQPTHARRPAPHARARGHPRLAAVITSCRRASSTSSRKRDVRCFRSSGKCAASATAGSFAAKRNMLTSG